jgi:AraC-like DNA-binding protein
MERLDKIISATGKKSRREVKLLVKQGRILVDGVPASAAEMKVDPAVSEILLDGEDIGYQRFTYIMLHKPAGVIERTSTDFYPTQTPWLSDALVYIRRHIGDGISANDVITHLGYSHTTVGKVFRRELGLSVQQEIIRYRRELACRLLIDTSLTAAEIADKCGYPSPQYFAHMFAAHFSTTPEKWRRKDT